ncbi:hypothetical protein [Hymenobacter antarcticus]|uniref:hypothetical protein n=1 Tax=Hymenobacter antarcticus TaxID=486270 RepID=UPI0031E74EBB
MKVNWAAHPEVTRAHKQLLAARAGSLALQRGTPTLCSTADVCAFTKAAGPDQALVLVNVRSTPSTCLLPAALANSPWTNMLQAGTLTLGT